MNSTGCEVNLGSNPFNCGSCFHNCSEFVFGVASNNITCNDRQCDFIQCNEGYEDCDYNRSNGCEPLNNIPHCGGCNITCNYLNAINFTCINGHCIMRDDQCKSGFGNCDNNIANGCESTLAANTIHCGECNNSCYVPNVVSISCNGGICEHGVCVDGWGECNPNSPGCETNTNSDINNCGSCGVICNENHPEALFVCDNGVCIATGCSSGYLLCDGTCILQTTSDCGYCGYQCDLPNAIEACVNRKCAISSCNFPFADCDLIPENGCEIDTSINHDHCGQCNHPVIENSICVNGIITCIENYLLCNGECINSQSDINHCSGDTCVNNPCDFPSEVCIGGICGTNPNCAPGTSSCSFSNTICSINLNNDMNNCGKCGIQCEENTQYCDNGNCICKVGRYNCDIQTNGCETSASIEDCGGCGESCASSHALATCISEIGECVIYACDEHYSDCDGYAHTGCEVNTGSDRNNCGNCGINCGTNTECFGGVCRCHYGYINCNSTLPISCDVNYKTDVMNCGSCGEVCPFDQRSNQEPICVNGICQTRCVSGFADCDNEAYGCETNLLIDPENCLGCGNACPIISTGKMGCGEDGCSIIRCNPFTGNCNGNLEDGCETSLDNSLNCGRCEVLCGDGEHCEYLDAIDNYHCVPDCPIINMKNCNNNLQDGCETNVMTSHDHCGNCNQSCSLTASCNGGECECNDGYLSCNNDNQCETYVKNDKNNCGSCRHICPTYPHADNICLANECILGSCYNGYKNCDGISLNGCESNILNSIDSCGDCSVICTGVNALAICNSGNCEIQSCIEGYGDCDGNFFNGCERKLDTVENCGRCNEGCNLANVEENSCEEYQCSVKSCKENLLIVI